MHASETISLRLGCVAITTRGFTGTATKAAFSCHRCSSAIHRPTAGAVHMADCGTIIMIMTQSPPGVVTA